MRQWLQNTQRLSHELSNFGSLALQIESQEWQTPEPHERPFAQSGAVFVREITLWLNNHCMSYGRVAINEESWPHLSDAILALGNQPIGEKLLHHDSQIKRGPFSYSRLWKPPTSIAQNLGAHFSRFSNFTSPHAMILLTESVSTKVCELKDHKPPE